MEIWNIVQNVSFCVPWKKRKWNNMKLIAVNYNFGIRYSFSFINILLTNDLRRGCQKSLILLVVLSSHLKCNVKLRILHCGIQNLVLVTNSLFIPYMQKLAFLHSRHTPNCKCTKLVRPSKHTLSVSLALFLCL